MESAALQVGEGKLVSTVITTASGKTFDLGTPGTRRHARRLRRMIAWRLKNEHAFREAFGSTYDRRGRLR